MSRHHLLLLLAGGTLAGCGSDAPHAALTQPETSNAAVEVATVSSTEKPVYYEATGTVKAQLNATLSSKVMARVTSVTAREGDTVRNGQTLIVLDTRELSAGVQMAEANLKASVVGVSNARTAVEMEAKTSEAKIAQSEAAVTLSRAALNAARSKLDLVLAGPRVQEKAQAHLAVLQAESALNLAKTQLERVNRLVSEGAMARKVLDEAQTAYEVALAQRDAAIQAEKISEEGSRTEEIRAAREAVAQAEAAVRQAEANLRFTRASALQTKMRTEEIRSAQAQVSQSSAALQSARVTLGYGAVAAPFDGRVVLRAADPGSMAIPGSPLMSVEGGALRLEVTVPESVLRYVAPQAEVRVSIDALEQELAATVDEIVPQGDPGSHTFLVKLRLPKMQGIHSAMFGRAFIPTKVSPTIAIPMEATWEREGLHYVYVVNPEGIVRLRIITVGKSLNGQIVVLSGLNPGERIVVGGRDGIKDGMRVASR